MSFQMTVKYDDVYKAVEELVGLKLHDTINGPPTSRFPLREFFENSVKNIVDVEEYENKKIIAVKVKENLYIVCHFNVQEPDDFCLAIEGEKAWEKVKEVATRLSKLTKVSYMTILSALVHALQGVISAEEGEIEEINTPDQVIEELLTWLPEYIAVTD